MLATVSGFSMTAAADEQAAAAAARSEIMAAARRDIADEKAAAAAARSEIMAAARSDGKAAAGEKSSEKGRGKGAKSGGRGGGRRNKGAPAARWQAGIPQTPWPMPSAWWPDISALAPPAIPSSPTGKTSGAAATTESLLDALAVGVAPKVVNRRQMTFDSRPATETPEGMLSNDQLLGHWVDSQGNAVQVLNLDAYDVRLNATLSKPPRADINLALKPVVLGGGWQCGHSVLDPVWSSETQLHWVATDGRVSVWVRPMEDVKDDGGGPKAGGGSAELPDAPVGPK